MISKKISAKSFDKLMSALDNSSYSTTEQQTPQLKSKLQQVIESFSNEPEAMVGLVGEINQYLPFCLQDDLIAQIVNSNIQDLNKTIVETGVQVKSNLRISAKIYTELTTSSEERNFE